MVLFGVGDLNPTPACWELLPVIQGVLCLGKVSNSVTKEEGGEWILGGGQQPLSPSPSKNLAVHLSLGMGIHDPF